MAWMTVVDVSSWMMFEAAGDSEADSDVSNDLIYVGLSDVVGGAAADDAMSCSSGDELRGMDHNAVADNLGFDDEDQEEDTINRENVEDEVDDDDGEVRQGASKEKVLNKEGRRHNSKICNCCDSAMMKLVDEKDQDRLFWENCLAS